MGVSFWFWFCLWLKCVLIGNFGTLIVAVVCCLVCKTKQRIQWIEFHDQGWCPEVLKRFVRRNIYEAIWVGPLSFATIVSHMMFPLLDKYKIDVILDLCSGSSGPSAVINETTNVLKRKQAASDGQEFKPITTILTDLFPQVSSWMSFSTENEHLLFSEKTVDATNINNLELNEILSQNGLKTMNETRVMRTIHGAFHHFTPELGSKILGDACRHRDAIVIADITSEKQFIDFFVNWLVQVVTMPHGMFNVAKFWLFQDNTLSMFEKVCHLVAMVVLCPVFQFIFVHDGLISLARGYGAKEFQDMARKGMVLAGVELESYDTEFVVFRGKDIKKVNKHYLKFILLDEKPIFGVFICAPKPN